MAVGIKVGSFVRVISGDHKRLLGKVKKVIRASGGKSKVIVDGVALASRVVKNSSGARSTVVRERAISISNVRLDEERARVEYSDRGIVSKEMQDSISVGDNGAVE